MWTAGLVNPFFDAENKGGIVRELVHLLKEKNAWGGWEGICFDIEVMKSILDEMVSGSGVDILFQTYIADVILENNKINGIIVQNKSGRKAYRSNIVIDCTGDGDVCALAGAEYQIGRPEDGRTQPMTLMFKLGNVDFMQSTPDDLINLMRKVINENNLRYQIGYKRPYILMLPGKKAAVVQMIHIKDVSPFDAQAMSKAYLQARRDVMSAVELFREFIPELKGVTLEETAPQIGVRESRRILGEYELTFDDLMKGQKFDDGITLCSFPIDIHEPNGNDQNNYFPKPYHIPYRSLVPKRIDGLLMAGRCISGTHEAQASYRVTGNCMAMGEAAGAAAAIAISAGQQPRAINSNILVKTLREEHGVLL